MISICSNFLIIYVATFFKICKFSVSLKIVVIKYNIIKSMNRSITNKIFINYVNIFEKSN